MTTRLDAIKARLDNEPFSVARDDMAFLYFLVKELQAVRDEWKEAAQAALGLTTTSHPALEEPKMCQYVATEECICDPQSWDRLGCPRA